LTLEAGPDFEHLLEFLRDARGFDFTGYKRASLTRRVTARCRELGIDDFRNYQDYLQVHADEFATLFNKILINITEFFRDRESWDYLAAHVVPRIAAKSGGSGAGAPGRRRVRRLTRWRCSSARSSARPTFSPG
jgi:two-component system CheB/CheR fusion protein